MIAPFAATAAALTGVVMVGVNTFEGGTAATGLIGDRGRTSFSESAAEGMVIGAATGRNISLMGLTEDLTGSAMYEIDGCGVCVVMAVRGDGLAALAFGAASALYRVSRSNCGGSASAPPNHCSEVRAKCPEAAGG